MIDSKIKANNVQYFRVKFTILEMYKNYRSLYQSKWVIVNSKGEYVSPV